MVGDLHLTHFFGMSHAAACHEVGSSGSIDRGARTRALIHVVPANTH